MTVCRPERFDVAIVGSGVAGSMLAGILAGAGARVALIDRQTHPRFAVGESSTPLADALLRTLGRKHRWQRLTNWATWGGWQRDSPGATVGKKRGFTYIRDRVADGPAMRGSGSNEEPNETAAPSGLTGRLREQRCLIAASTEDEVSDTHWHRATSDSILHRDALGRGAVDFSGCTINELSVEPEIRIRVRAGNHDRMLVAGTLIDASGSGWVHRATNAADWTPRMQTNTSCRYAHFRYVGSSPDSLRHHDDPFDLDDAAVHHWFGSQGWAWVLRFGPELASVGWVHPGGPAPGSMVPPGRLSDVLCSARRDADESPTTDKPFIADFDPAVVTDHWRSMRRIQRWGPAVLRPRVWLLPTAAATIDPLHSTGLAHALAGVDRLANRFLSAEGDDSTYGQLVHDEVAWVDRLVSLAYQQIHDFDRFVDACQLFLVAAIRSEHAMDGGRHDASDVLPDGGLFGVRDAEFRRAMESAIERLSDPTVSTQQRRLRICDTLQPFNVAGLFSSIDGVYRRSATKSPAIRDANLATSTENVT